MSNVFVVKMSLFKLERNTEHIREVQYNVFFTSGLTNKRPLVDWKPTNQL